MYRQIHHKRAFGWADVLVLTTVGALIYGLVGLAQRWTSGYELYNVVELSPDHLPKYVFFSLMRALTAYFLSLGFTLVYGYIAAKSKRAERLMIPVLDILQSIPVLGFLPGLVLGLGGLFPKSNIGLELACIIMIFTGQAWNMTFSFYSSLKLIPKDLNEVSTIIRLNWFQKFRTIELPFAAIGLAWNSLMSMAGGWFFLTVCESSVLGGRRFQLPGIGSYMATAMEQNNRRAIIYGVVAMCLLIIFVDFVIWRPVMAWVRKFQMEEIQEDVADLPFVTSLLRESFLLDSLTRRVRVFTRRYSARKIKAAPAPVQTPQMQPGVRLKLAEIRDRIGKHKGWGARLLTKIATPLGILVCLWGATRFWELIRTLEPHDWRVIWGSVGLTFVRVFAAVFVGSLWAIPVGIVIGQSPRLTRIFQPFVQLLASFPAPMLYPIALALMFKVGIGIHWGSAVLMMLGAQWYILFNVLAGATIISRDLKDTLTMINVSRWTRWTKLYLPSAFPSLVTGWVTAAGGAWNASIVAEFIPHNGSTLIAPGIGSMISRASESANFPMLGGCLGAMVLAVVGLNWSWWRWINDVAENRFKFEK